MKPVLRQITATPQYSFVVRKDIGNKMLSNWHYHPEIELLYFKRSVGTWLIGDRIGHFKSGDIILIGTNLPHCFRHEYVKQQKEMRGECICIKFEPDLFGDIFLSLPETKAIKNLLVKCGRGLQIVGRTRKQLAEKMNKIIMSSPSKKLISLLGILEQIAESREIQTLSSNGFTQLAAGSDTDKIKTIFEYTFNNYSEKISIEDVADLLNMTRQSFCRYFKNKTRKTYIQFLMEVRIGHACRLLVEDEKNVKEISYDCGYNNISHFNHQFKSITQKKPLEYKRDYLKNQ